MVHNSIPEIDSPIGSERLKSSSASIAGVPINSGVTMKGKVAGQSGTSRRFGFLNSRSNSSTDNLSISSTVSSASVMIRKLGNLGRSARRNGVMGLTKIFKDKSEAAAGGYDRDDRDDGDESLDQSRHLNGSKKVDRFKKSSYVQHQKNTPSTSVAQVQAEVDRSLSVEFPGMTPAAAFIHKQKQQFAQQEAQAAAAAAAAAAATTIIASPTNSSHPATHSHNPNILNSGHDASASDQSRAAVPPKSKSKAGSQAGNSNATAAASATEARKKMIEKEKEKLKNKKSRKWGFGVLGGSSSTSTSNNSSHQPEARAGSSSAEDARDHPSRFGSDIEDNEEWEGHTVREATGAGDGFIDALHDGLRRSVEELREDDDHDENAAYEDYDMDSLFGNSSSEALGASRPGLKPRPSKEAVPKKGILKNAQNFSQEQHLSIPPSLSSKPVSVATTPDSLRPTISLEETSQASLPRFGRASSATTIQSIIGGGSQTTLDLRLGSVGIQEIKERRATFAQHLSVHTTWPPAIYDRRGELATCNRLTPTLAQRIKEEINAFKMEEMEVHYASRVHTHFFV